MKRLLALICLALCCHVAWGQNYRVIYGRVLDAEGKPLANATIMCDTEVVFVTGSNGQFECKVSVYSREVEVSAPEFLTKTASIDGSYLTIRLSLDPTIQARRKAEQQAREEEEARQRAEEEAARLAEEEAQRQAEAEIERARQEEEERIEAERRAEEARIEAERRAEQRRVRQEAFANKKDNFFISFDVTIPGLKNANVAYGPMLGWCRKVGVYTKLAFSPMPEWDFSREDLIGSIYLSGEYRASYNAITAGILIKLCKPLYLYTGIGGTWGEVVCESALSGRDYIMTRYSKIGIDGGILFKIKMLTLNGGILYAPTMGCGCSLGIGICF